MLHLSVDHKYELLLLSILNSYNEILTIIENTQRFRKIFSLVGFSSAHPRVSDYVVQ